ncbi:hypothetical protein BASA50_002087 [Batrachochytrium salamandrivorans]|uniref:RING-type domain-containing protein n=1 Tax=Batrachochytrium salamandrivorans TaxID=1357716 RepID=A0ABQ8FMB6_9FUNG|nr:hypothetical protein BASA50_002087 [Batrachochytrium salamandrivorans]
MMRPLSVLLVTIEVCFEHRKNVCETCIQSDHTRCIVRSYLQWLQDSDFDPVCGLCRKGLNSGEVVRLSCLDLFHVACINEHCAALPEHTAPAGYACTICSVPIIPAENSGSSIAKNIWATFKTERWSQHILPKKIGGLGLGAGAGSRSMELETNGNHRIGDGITNNSLGSDGSAPTPSVMPTASNVAKSLPRVDLAIRSSDSIGQHHISGIAPSAQFSDSRINRKSSQLRIAIDPDDKKHKRKASSFFGSFDHLLPKGRLTFRKTITYVLLVIVLIFLVKMVFFTATTPQMSRLPAETKSDVVSQNRIQLNKGKDMDLGGIPLVVPGNADALKPPSV